MTEMDKTLPTENTGTEITRFNALKHGILSRYTVLPWEDEGEYQALVEALTAEHTPHGPTEEHLVEELAGILWRKRRLRLAEAAAYQRGLQRTTEPFSETGNAALAHLLSSRDIGNVNEAISATSEDTADETTDLEDDLVMTGKALAILRGGKPNAYEKAVAALREDTRQWWQELLHPDPDESAEDVEELDQDVEPVTPDAEGLQRAIEDELLPWYVKRLRELENRPSIRAQAFGEALDPVLLEPLARYEVHLDRKLERTLTMLLRLQDLRQVSIGD